MPAAPKGGSAVISKEGVGSRLLIRQPLSCQIPRPFRRPGDGVAVIIDRFGLNYDFIEENKLTWIDNLETSSGGRLDDPKHQDHHKSYVQSYLRQFGVRKVEANALVVRPEPGRELCRQAILKYLDVDDPQKYEDAIRPIQHEVRREVTRRLLEMQG